MGKNHFQNFISDWINANHPLLSNAILGKALGISGAQISHYRQGQNLPPRSRLHQIARQFPWDLEQAEWRCGLVPSAWLALDDKDFIELFQLVRLVLLCKNTKTDPSEIKRYIDEYVRETNGKPS